MKPVNFKGEKLFWIITVNSTAFYILAYITVMFTTNLMTVLLGKLDGRHGAVRYWGNEIFVDKVSDWDISLVILVFFGGIAISLILGLLSGSIFNTISAHLNPWKLFFMWGYFIGMTWFFGNYIIGAVVNFGGGVVMEYLSIPFFLRLVPLLVSVIILAYTGNSVDLDVKRSFNLYQQTIGIVEYRRFVTAQILYPYVVANIILLLMKIPHHQEFGYYESFIWLCMLIPVIVLYHRRPLYEPLRYRYPPPKPKIFVWPLLISIAIMLLYRFGLGKGIYI